MLSKFAFPALLALCLSSALVRASPIDSSQDQHQDLIVRDNKSQLKCGNAPYIVAGNPVSPSDSVLTTQLPPSGSNQKWFQYLWCTVGTQTYTFWGLGGLDRPANDNLPLPYRNFYYAFSQAQVSVVDTIASNGGDGPIPDGRWSMRPPNTNIEVGVRSAGGGTMTYGILESTLAGLAQAAENYNPENAPMVFQINDGKWGEVGYGYAGIIHAYGQCIYDFTPQVLSACTDVTNGWVFD